jgi:hypothetical protein
MGEYYTPSIEEFHIGFEYEGLVDYYKGEYKTFTIENTSDLIQRMETYDSQDMDFIRVKYLDREDIESLGWKQGELPYQYFDGIHMLVDLKHNKYSINHIADDVCIFEGTIKNKSELVRLLKQLDILK